MQSGCKQQTGVSQTAGIEVLSTPNAAASDTAVSHREAR
jgi:hypothetical protein